MKVCEFVRVPRISDWAKFAVQQSKDESPRLLLTVRLLFISVHLSCVPLTTWKVYSVSQTPPNFKQRTSLEVVHNSRNEASSLTRIPFLSAKAGMLRTERVVTGCCWAVWGRTVIKKECVVMGSMGQSGILLQNASSHKCFSFPPSTPPPHVFNSTQI